MKKPVRKKYPKKPKLPKGGIKTENQLDAYDKRVSEYNKKVAAIDKEYATKLKAYEAFRKKVDRTKAKLK